MSAVAIQILWDTLDSYYTQFRDLLKPGDPDPNAQLARGKCIGLAFALSVLTSQSVESVIARASARHRGG